MFKNKLLPTNIWLINFLLFCILIFSPRIYATESLSIIPLPANIQSHSGEFLLTPTTTIYIQNKNNKNAQLLTEYIQKNYGWNLKIQQGQPKKNNEPFILLTDTIPNNYVMRNDTRDQEAYFLSVLSDRIELQGNDIGQFYAVKTLLQLLPEKESEYQKKSNTIAISAVEINDSPRFIYRGMHLDVARHLYSIDFIKKFLDQMAFYKLNRFHWHLTDDQGWRLEIKQYPKLTEVGGYRTRPGVFDRFSLPLKEDNQAYGGFYTQEQVKDIIEYAAERHITVIPEIELPAHSLAALAAYPQYACQKGELQAGPNPESFIFCPYEETFTFLENILTEVIALFPSQYIHIGGDEANMEPWKNSPIAQDVMQRQGLKTEHELQSWFVQRVQKFVNSKGRTIIGWDEILEGGLAPNAVVMSWRGEDGGIAAAKQHHDVIMTPGKCCYFDKNQRENKNELFFESDRGTATLENVYEYNPVPAILTPIEIPYIQGVQGNLWTEFMPYSHIVEYKAFPRVLAISEIAWSPQEKRNFTDFERRLYSHYSYLDHANIQYRIPAPHSLKENISSNKYRLILISPIPNGRIHYTLDDSLPSLDSPLYSQPINITTQNNKEIKINTIIVNSAGRQSNVYTLY